MIIVLCTVLNWQSVIPAFAGAALAAVALVAGVSVADVALVACVALVAVVAVVAAVASVATTDVCKSNAPFLFVTVKISNYFCKCCLL